MSIECQNTASQGAAERVYLERLKEPLHEIVASDTSDTNVNPGKDNL